MCVRCVSVGDGGGGNGCTAEQATQRSAEAGGYFDQIFCSHAVVPKSISARMLIVQTCAEKRYCFAEHQPSVARCGWLQPVRNFLST